MSPPPGRGSIDKCHLGGKYRKKIENRGNMKAKGRKRRDKGIMNKIKGIMNKIKGKIKGKISKCKRSKSDDKKVCVNL
jgi:hypothetical protein